MTGPTCAPVAVAFAGAVLAGGRSRRMGRDKALLRLPDGRLLALVAAQALRDAGGAPVVAVGGDPGLADHGLAVLADRYPGAGPLGGLLTGLAELSLAPAGPGADERVLVVLTCDLPSITGHEVTSLVEALRAAPDAQAAVALLDGRPQFLSAAYRRSALALLAAAFDGGERSVRRAAAGLDIVEVDGLGAVQLADVDSPTELAAHVEDHLADVRGARRGAPAGEFRSGPAVDG